MIRFALRRPISIMVAILAITYFSFSAIKNINVDIFPEVELPAIYISMPYGGLTPQYMDGFMANEFQKVLLFVSGVKDIEFKSIQGLTLMKLTFYPGTDMAQSAGEVSTMVSRAMGFLPAGATPPMVVRFDDSSLPIGQLVFESPQRSLNELQNLVITRVRPMFVNVPGVTAPAPFGGNARTIVVKVNPSLMQSYGISAEEVTMAITQNSLPSPAGNVRIGEQNLMSPVNSIANGPEEFLNTPVRVSDNQTVFIKDIATVEDAGDVTTGYAIVNGQRSIYLPVIKKADASTLDVVENLKSAMPMLKNTLPEDVKISYVFDQSGHIKNSLSTLIFEGILGAILTGLMVFLFLKDSRGALIVVLTIPISLLTAVVALYLMGQTINMMTLSGLALAIGILVDEATVTIENIHQHFEMKKGKARAILDAVLEISVPKLLILLSILAVLIPSFLMTGIPKDMFMPLSIAVGFAMIASFIFSQTFVPIMANWLMKKKPHQRRIAGKKQSGFNRFKIKYTHFIGKIQRKNKHLEAPFLKEREDYLSHYADKGLCTSSLKGVADYLLRVIEFLHLKKSGLVTLKTIENAALEWAKYKFNHPMKRTFSESGRKKFIWFSIDWLKRINRLAPLLEASIPLFNRLFERRHALSRHVSAPLLQERILYLEQLEALHSSDSTMRHSAQYQLIIMEYLHFDTIRTISIAEIKEAALKWGSCKKVVRRKGTFSISANRLFTYIALSWLEMLGCLEKEPKVDFPFREYRDKYLEYMTDEQGLSEETVNSRASVLKNFLINIGTDIQLFETLSPIDIDKVVIRKYDKDNYSRRSVQGYATVIRTFLRYAESQQWCRQGLADSVKAPRVYQHETLPSSPGWDDVKKLLESCKTDHPTDIRDYAILMLLTVYGLRRSEVARLRLEDIYWAKEQLYLRRAKGSKPQMFPFSKIVGEAVIRYLKEVRPKHCTLKEVFIGSRSPYRALSPKAITAMVDRRLKPLDLPIKHHGPHALRHACATHLINEGFSLKEISDHLGHLGLETTRIYAKVDLVKLAAAGQFRS